MKYCSACGIPMDGHVCDRGGYPMDLPEAPPWVADPTVLEGAYRCSACRANFETREEMIGHVKSGHKVGGI